MRTHIIGFVLTVGIVAGGSLPAAGQEASRRLDLRFEADGTVTLLAFDVSVREILDEWARQCQCHIVNAAGLTEQVNVPLQFLERSQEEVLSSLLRTASGYALTPRREGMIGPSQFETIYVVPTSRTSQTPYAAPSPTSLQVPLPTAGTPVDEIPPVIPIPTRPADQAEPQQPTPPAPRLPGTPSRFVPIVGVDPSGSTTQPGRVTPAPPSNGPGQ